MAFSRSQQTSDDAPQGSGRLRGRVVSAELGEPLGGAKVLAWSERVPAREAIADADGQYEIAQLLPGAYLVSAEHDGYLSASYGQKRLQDWGTAVTVDEGQTVEGIDLALPRAGVISVRLTDDEGGAIEDALIFVQRFEYAPGGERRLVNAASGRHRPAVTDAAGDARVAGLRPGEYVIRAEVHTIRSGGAPAAPREGFSAAYYPGTASSDRATLVPIGLAEEVAIVFPLVRVPLVRVSGTVRRSTGEPASGMELMIGLAGPARGLQYGAGTVAVNGTFVITGIPPGEYTLELRERLRRGETASVLLTVDGADIDGLRLVTSPGWTIEGVVVFDGSSPRPASRDIQAFALPPGIAGGGWVAGGSHPSHFPPNGRVDEEGRFRITGVEGRVQLDAMAHPWVVSAVTADGRDITQAPLDLQGTGTLSGVVITLTDRVSTVTGHVHDSEARRVSRYVVVLLPDARLSEMASTRVHVAHANVDGRFVLTRLRPGRYRAAALDFLEWGRQYDPAVQRQLERIAQPVTVSEGQTVTLELEVSPAV